MKRLLWLLILAALLAWPARPAAAAVNVERGSAENPMVEISRSILYGALAGLMVGGALALASEDESGEPVRWGIVGGTFVGLGVGIYFVTHRPQPDALLEFERGTPSLDPLGAIEVAPDGGARLRAIAVRF